MLLFFCSDSSGLVLLFVLSSCVGGVFFFFFVSDLRVFVFCFVFVLVPVFLAHNYTHLTFYLYLVCLDLFVLFGGAAVHPQIPAGGSSHGRGQSLAPLLDHCLSIAFTHHVFPLGHHPGLCLF